MERVGKANVQALLDEIERLRPKDELAEAAFYADASLADFFREVVAVVRYADYARDFTTAEYRCAIRMALFELWGYERAGKRTGKEFRDERFSPAAINWIAQQPAYERLCDALRASFDDLKDPRGYKDFVRSDADQQAIYQSQRFLALHAPDLKVRELAARALGEKMMPTLRVQEEVRRVINVDERTAGILHETLRMIIEAREKRDVQLRAATGKDDVRRDDAPGDPQGSGREPLLLRAGDPGAEPTH